ncbi:MAG: AAA family ATPase, partial [Blastocatellia bacterium]
MRLLRWSLRGFNTFPNTVSVDLEEFGPGLIALVGPNGAGKTTLMEAALASIYKQFVTKPGGLYPYAIGNDAFIESQWQNGSGVYT